jgi:hypothetical protein
MHTRKILAQPGQTFALVLVTASTRISFFFVFFCQSAALPLFHLKNVEAGTQRIDFFFKKRSDLFSFRFVPVLNYLRAPELSGRSVAAAM